MDREIHGKIYDMERYLDRCIYGHIEWSIYGKIDGQRYNILVVVLISGYLFILLSWWSGVSCVACYIVKLLSYRT